ncbi:MAG TPA: glycine C-acetyltransferase [Solirubrobacteraceae bacterium]|nr:glycine C-acetyltransferase [Solirubrobacteraceae bacterium]
MTQTHAALLDTVADRLQEIRSAGGGAPPPVLVSAQGPTVIVDGVELINLASNDYLGLAAHPGLVQAASDALHTYGVGSGAVRPIVGTMDVHRALERRLAELKDAPDALLVPSGFTANSGTVGALLGKGDAIVSDELNHASIIDGCRLSGARISVYRHGDVADAERALQAVDDADHVLLVTDGVFSMDGDIAPLPELLDLADSHGATVMVDDAHATGVLGETGRGTAEHFGCSGRVPIQIGTLSKALGTLGGFVAASQAVVDYLRVRGRPYLFSTSQPPSVAAAGIAAVQLLTSDTARRRRLGESAERFRAGLQRLGYDTGASVTPIVPVLLGEEHRATALSSALRRRGVLAQAIVFPTVAAGKARVRAIVTAAHSDAQLDHALEAFAAARDEI